MSRLFFSVLLLAVLASTASSVGCSSEKATADPQQQAHMKVLGILYGKFQGTSRGQAPANETQFIEYLNTKRPSWEKLVDSAEQLLVSPRDGQPMVILYSSEYSKQNSEGSLYVAYEREGVDEIHQVLNIRGDVEEMDSLQIEQRFSK